MQTTSLTLETLVKELRGAENEYAGRFITWFETQVDPIIDQELLSLIRQTVAHGAALDKRWAKAILEERTFFTDDEIGFYITQKTEGPHAKLDELTDRYLEYLSQGTEDVYGTTRDLLGVRKWYVEAFASENGGEKEEIAVSRIPLISYATTGELTWRERITQELRENSCEELAERLLQDPYIGIEQAWNEVKRLRAEILMVM